MPATPSPFFKAFTVHGLTTGTAAAPLLQNHGDEYESQIAIAKITRWIDPADVAGRLIIIPTISLAAALECKRVWPE